MTNWDEQVAYMRESFIDSLVSRGFELIPDTDGAASSETSLRGVEYEVLLGTGFPFAAPKVRTLVPTPQSWHLDNEGSLCLYTSEGSERLPWLDVDGFLGRIAEWFKWNDAGWPEDAPILDLEAYLSLGHRRNIVTYENLDRLDGGYISINARRERFWHVIGAGKAPKKSSRKQRVTGFVTNIGEVLTPPRSWEELLDLCPESETAQIRSAIKAGQVQVLLIRYRRASHHGCLALSIESPTTPPVIVRAISVDRSALQLRGGGDTKLLGQKHVYLIGAGALGSNIADLLNRVGVGELTVRDHDMMLPGNLVRHAIGLRDAHGVNKAEAMARWLHDAEYSVTKLVAIEDALSDPSDVLPIFSSCDLLIDATADGSVTRMLTDAAVTSGIRFISACTKAEGHVLRVDVVPTLNGAEPLPDKAPVGSYEVADAVYETGCADPVSMTPPYAITEAASMAVRHAVALLKGEPLTDSGEVREW
jgi:molybdopterin/thiamine biosynthesis adenylyltransferase